MAWNIEGVAASEGFELRTMHPLDDTMLGECGYQHKRTYKDDAFPMFNTPSNVHTVGVEDRIKRAQAVLRDIRVIGDVRDDLTDIGESDDRSSSSSGSESGSGSGGGSIDTNNVNRDKVKDGERMRRKREAERAVHIDIVDALSNTLLRYSHEKEEEYEYEGQEGQEGQEGGRERSTRAGLGGADIATAWTFHFSWLS